MVFYVIELSESYHGKHSVYGGLRFKSWPDSHTALKPPESLPGSKQEYRAVCMTSFSKYLFLHCDFWSRKYEGPIQNKQQSSCIVYSPTLTPSAGRGQIFKVELY